MKETIILENFKLRIQKNCIVITRIFKFRRPWVSGISPCIAMSHFQSKRLNCAVATILANFKQSVTFRKVFILSGIYLVKLE